MDNKVRYIHIPKTGGCAIQLALKEVDMLKAQNGHFRAIDRISTQEFENPDIPIIASIRNPFDRLYSMYHYFKDRDDGFRHPITFEEFVKTFPEKYLGKFFWSHSQRYFLSYKDNHLIQHIRLLRFEHLDKDYADFCKDIGIDNRLKHINGNTRKPVKVDKNTIYTDEMVELVKNFFQKDCDLGCYTYEQWLNSPWNY